MFGWGWLAVGHTDLLRGMNSLAIQVQEVMHRDPHAGDLYVFQGKRGHLVKILWHGIGMSRNAKRLERGGFIRPSPAKPAPAKVGGQSRGAAGLYARRVRLAQPGAHLAASGSWLRLRRIGSPFG